MARTGTANGSKTPDTSDLADQIETLKSDIAELTRLVGAYGQSKGREAGAAARETAENVKAKGEAQIEDLKVQAAQAQKAAEDMVARQPGAALGIAVGLGFLAGFLVSRK